MPVDKYSLDKTKSRRKKSAGFALVGTIVLLPLALAILFVAAATALVLRADTQASAICDRGTFQMQDSRAKAIATLLQLNPQARMLQRERKIWERCVEFDPEPDTKAACEFQLMATEAEQEVLAVEQNLIIGGSNAKAALDAARMTMQLVKNQPRISSTSLQVEAVQKAEIAPEYKVVSNFSNRQQVNVHYSLSLASLLDPTIRSFLGPLNSVKALSRSCAATVIQKGKKYQPAMTEAKS